MHVTPSNFQVVTLSSAVEAGLSKCTTLQKLTVWESPPSVTAVLLKTMTVIRSLEEVELLLCDYGMFCVRMCECVSVQVCKCGYESLSMLSIVHNYAIIIDNFIRCQHEWLCLHYCLSHQRWWHRLQLKPLVL